jgi:hypothetical protein
MPPARDRSSELRDVLQSLNAEPAPSVQADERKSGDIPILLTWLACLISTVAAILVGYSNFAAQDSSPKQIAAMALTFLQIGGAYVVARCVHEIILASRR